MIDCGGSHLKFDLVFPISERKSNKLASAEGNMQTTSTSYATVFWVCALSVSVALLSNSSTMAEKSIPSQSSDVYIVYTEKPLGEAEPHHLQTLSTVVGSDDAAKEALLYTYTAAATGFSAKLTAEQAEAMSKQPGILQVVPSETLQPHSGAKMSAQLQF